MIKIAYIGDLIFGDQPVKFGYGCYSQNHDFDYFSEIDNQFKKYDYVLANFETILKEDISDKNISNWSMVTTKRVVEKILNSGIKGVSVANNHTMDYGKKWFDYTVNELEESGIDVFGKKGELYKIINIKQKKVAIVSFSDLKVKQTNICYNYNISEADLTGALLELDKVDLKICYCHWGSEFITKATEDQIKKLNVLVKFNFDCIVGHHAHIVQDMFIYKGTPVFLSIGNFISDYWQHRAKKSMILIHEVDKELGSVFKKIDCYINDLGKPEIISNETTILLNKYNNVVVSNEEINKERWRLRKEYLKEISFNFYKIKGKGFMLKWLFSRLIYVLGNFNKEKKNPNIIYEKYKA